MVHDIQFVRDVIMSRETFDRLPQLPAPTEVRKVRPGTLCRVHLEQDGRAGGWHAIAVIHMNGTERAVASRIIIRQYQPED